MKGDPMNPKAEVFSKIQSQCLINSDPHSSSTLTTKEYKNLETKQVLIKLSYSCVNYKDALAVTHKGKILRKFPLTPGIDGAGKVVWSLSEKFKIGDRVFFNGSGFGELHDGGFSEYVIAHEDLIVTTPENLSDRECMILGTAGFTAALSLYRMEMNGQTPQKGPILVTGASGGVGKCAIQILHKNNYEVWAVSEKKDYHHELLQLGATKAFTIEELKLSERPLESARWAGAIDNLGGNILAKILSHTDLWGNVASVGLAESADLKTTVMPFILRGVSLLGASSANCPMKLKTEIWQRLSTSWKPQQLESIVGSEIKLSEVVSYSDDLLNQKARGRALVKF